MIDYEKLCETNPVFELKEAFSLAWKDISSDKTVVKALSTTENAKKKGLFASSVYSAYFPDLSHYEDRIQEQVSAIESGDKESWNNLMDYLDLRVIEEKRAGSLDVLDELPSDYIDRIPLRKVEVPIYKDGYGRYVADFVEGKSSVNVIVEDPIAEYVKEVGKYFPELQEELLKQYERICAKSSLRKDSKDLEKIKTTFI